MSSSLILKTDIGSSEILTIKGKKHLFATTSSPIETQTYLISLADGAVVLNEKSDVSIGIYDVKDDKNLGFCHLQYLYVSGLMKCR